jgi:Fe-S-cluster containining protein
MSRKKTLEEALPLPIIAGRDCDGCTACCSFPPIRTIELQKPANTLCHHCIKGQGCGVYDVRPTVCRGFFCGYFFLPELSEEWHPKNSGVVIRSEHFDEDVITILILELNAFLVSEEFAGMVGAWVQSGIGVEFERVGPPGHLPAKMRVNEILEEAVASRDLREMQKMFAWCLAHIDKSHTWEKDETEFRSGLA